MPAARPHEQHRRIVAERVLLLARVERDRPLERIGQVPLALDAVRPGRRVRVLEVGHEHARTRVERVDHHLAVDRARDLDPPVGDLVRRRRHPPVAGAHLRRLRQEIRQLAGIEPLRPHGPRARATRPPARRRTCARRSVRNATASGVRTSSVCMRRFSQRGAARGRNAGAHAAVIASSNCSSSVEPLRASVELVPPVIVSSTSSK